MAIKQMQMLLEEREREDWGFFLISLVVGWLIFQWLINIGLFDFSTVLTQLAQKVLKKIRWDKWSKIGLQLKNLIGFSLNFGFINK